MEFRSKLNDLLKCAYTEIPPKPSDDEVPQHLLQPQVDVLILHCDEDSENAAKLSRILTKLIRLDNDEAPKVGLIQQGLRCAPSPFEAVRHLHRTIDRSTFLFLYLTKTFTTDTWAELQKDECIMEAIHNEEKWGCVVPVHTVTRWKDQYNTPFGLRCLKGLDIQMMLKGRSISEVDEDKLEVRHLDRYFVRNVTDMLNSKLRLRLQREKRQQQELEKWFSERERKNQEKPRETAGVENQRNTVKGIDSERNLALVPVTFTATFWHRLVTWFIYQFRNTGDNFGKPN